MKTKKGKKRLKFISLITVLVLLLGIIPSFAGNINDEIINSREPEEVTESAIRNEDGPKSTESAVNKSTVGNEDKSTEEKSKDQVARKGVLEDKSSENEIGNEAQNLEELKSLIKNAKDDKETLVKLNGNIDGKVDIPQSKNIILDVNSKSITNSSDGYTITVTGELSLIGSGSVSAEKNGAVYVKKNGEFTLNNKVSIDNKNKTPWGLVNNGKSDLSGGYIKNCKTGNYGGAVYNTGQINVDGCEISGNSAYQGGGIFNTDSATVNFNSGSITNNKSSTEGGGIYNGGNFNMTGGEISECSAPYMAGALYNEATGNVNLSGGKINKNKVEKYSFSYDTGGIIENLGNMTVNNVTFEENHNESGNAVICNKASLKMTGGVIRNNSADGLENGKGAECTISGGIITGNDRGISTLMNSKLTMNGGAVFNNKGEIYSNPIDITWSSNFSMPENDPEIDILSAGAMTADGYEFSEWYSPSSKYSTKDKLTMADQKGNYGMSFYAVIKTKPGTEGDGIFLDGEKGKDENDGTTASQAVKTMEKAKTLLDENQGIKKIYVTGTVEVNQQETWSLKEDQVLMRHSSFSGNLVKINKNGALTLKDMTIDGNKGKVSFDGTQSLIYVYEGKLVLEENSVLRNNKLNNTGFGSAVNVRLGSLVMNDKSSVTSNRSLKNGGGISIYESNFVMNGGLISENTADNCGGGVILSKGSTFEFSGGKIEKNKAYSGGGVNIGGDNTVTASPGSTFNMTGGEINGNSVGGLGGGIFIQDESKADITVGKIQNNSAGGFKSPYAGGGIYVNGSRTVDGQTLKDGELHLSNAIISENTADALYGGGIAACPTAVTKLYFSNGCAIYGNESGGAAEQIYSIATQRKEQTFISDYMLGGGLNKWMISDGNNKKTEADTSQYQYTNQQVILDNHCSKQDTKLAEKKAKVFITGNQSDKYGGGIGSNGTVIIGDAPSTELILSKAWINDEEANRPESIKVNLTVGGFALKEITLTKDEYWVKRITDLPEEFWEQENMTVTGAEIGPEGYKSEIEALVSKEDKKINVNIKNTLNVKTYGDLSIEKKVTGTDSSTKQFNFKLLLTDENGVHLAEPFKYEKKDITDKQEIQGTQGGIISNGDNITLTSGQSIKIKEIPNGTKYEVIESDANKNGYQTEATNNMGSIGENETVSVMFNNKKMTETKEYSTFMNLSANKLFDSRNPKDNIFKFTLKDEKENILETVTNDGSKVIFKPIEYKAQGTYVYTISEEKNQDTKVVYDKNIFKAIVTITESGDNLIGDIEYYYDDLLIDGTPTFLNFTKTEGFVQGETDENDDPAPEQSVQGEEASEAKTSDNLRLYLLIGILIISAIASMIIMRRKANR